MFERFTERARKVTVLAHDEARSFQAAAIFTDHLLLALILEDEGIAARALKQVGVTYEKVADLVEHGPDLPLPDQLPFHDESKKALEFALREALSLGHNYIGTEHILLGILRNDESLGVMLLGDLIGDGEHQVAAEKIRDAILTLLVGPRPPEATVTTGTSATVVMNPEPESFEKGYRAAIEDLKKHPYEWVNLCVNMLEAHLKERQR